MVESSRQGVTPRLNQVPSNFLRILLGYLTLDRATKFRVHSLFTGTQGMTPVTGGRLPDHIHPAKTMKTLLTVLSAAALMSTLSFGAESKYKEGGCCDKAAKKGEKCAHPCCVDAEKAGKVCEKCNKK